MAKNKGERTRTRGTVQDDAHDDDDDIPDIPGSGGGASVVSDQVEDDIDGVLADIGEGAVVRLKRMNPETGNLQHVGVMQAADFSLESMMDMFGGGVYYAQVRNGRDVIADKVRIELDTSVPPKNPKARVIAGAGGDLMQTMMLQRMDSERKGSEMMMGAITTMISGMGLVMKQAMDMRPQTVDPLAQMEKMVTILRGTSNPQERPGLADLRDLIAISKELGGGGDNDGTGPMIMKAIETVGEIVKKSPDRSGERPRALPAQTPVVTGAPVVRAESGTVVLGDRPWITATRPHMVTMRPMLSFLSPDTASEMIHDILKGKPEWGDLIADVTEGLPEETELSAMHFLAFGERTAKTFALPDETKAWLAEVALQLVEITNDDAIGGDDEPIDITDPGNTTPGVTT